MPYISAAKVLQLLTQRHIYPLYLLLGEETYLIHEYTSAFVERILGTAVRDFNCNVFDADSDSLPEALSVARTLPMMASHRVVVLHGLHQLRKADLQQLTAYAEQPAESTALICSSHDSDPKKCLPYSWRKAVVVECHRLAGTSLCDWVANTVGQYGYTITDEAVQALLQDQQNDLWIILREIEKLCTYAGEEKEITLAAVQDVCQASRLHSIFALSDAFGTRNILQAITIIDGLLNQGEPPLLIFSMIVRHLRLLWSIQQLEQQHQDMSEMVKALGLPVHVCRRLAPQSRRFSSQRLGQLYHLALQADFAFKTTNRPSRTILEGLVFELCSSN
jgi:DNA polymerase-3 subunit delta